MDNNISEVQVTPLQLMLSSWTGALATSVIVTPLDVVKIRMQAQQKEFMKKKCFIYCNGLMEHLCYCNATSSQWFLKSSGSNFNGTIDAFVKIVRNEGVSSLWSGLPPTLVMALPATMVYFTMYDQIRGSISRKLKVPSNDPPLWVSVVSGGLARTISATAISPLELVRTKMQSKKLRYSQVFNGVKMSVESQGILSLWRGLGPTILRDVPFSALYWLNYEFYKKKFNQTTDPSFAFSLAAGAASGSVCAVITLPFDVVKTYRQIDLGEKEVLQQEKKALNSWKQSSTLEILKKIHSERGVAGLFSGITPRVVKVAPACAIMISTYEYGKTFFKKYNSSGKTFMEFLLEN